CEGNRVIMGQEFPLKLGQRALVPFRVTQPRSTFMPFFESRRVHGAQSHGPESLKPLPGLDVSQNAPAQSAALSSTHLTFRGVVVCALHTYWYACDRPHIGVAATYGKLPDDWHESLWSLQAGQCRDALDRALDISAVWDLAYVFVTLCSSAALCPLWAASSLVVLVCRCVGLGYTAQTGAPHTAFRHRSAASDHRVAR